MLQINVVTLFPQFFEQHLINLPLRKAVEKSLLGAKLWNLRDYALDSYGTVDNKPYGGGVGMLLMMEPIYNALSDIHGPDFERRAVKDTGRIVVLSPSGKKYNQAMARKFAQESKITLICGRYEGIDARVEQNLATDVVSIGDYVLSGGELPALVIMESVTRLLEGVLEKTEASIGESFTDNFIEYPQYTRPEDFKGYKVPDVLLSGNHKEIEKWKKMQQKPTDSETTH